MMTVRDLPSAAKVIFPLQMIFPSFIVRLLREIKITEGNDRIMRAAFAFREPAKRCAVIGLFHPRVPIPVVFRWESP